MNRNLAILGVLIVVIGIVASSALFTVRMTEQVIVVQFGEPKQVIQEPGLHVKIPFIQEVRSYERRILDVDPPVEQVILADRRRLDVDAFVRYRITDPLQFFQTVANEEGARARISTVTNAALRRVLGNQDQQAVLSELRANIMQQIQREVEQQASVFGIAIVDVRIGRADVPEDTRESVYDRMRSEREQEAAEFRAQGTASARRIRSYADCVETVILAHARRQSQMLRGIGDANAITIQADAFSRAPDFFAFYRSLEAYRTSLSSEDTTLVLSPNSEFFRFFNELDTTALRVPPTALPTPGSTPGAETGPMSLQGPLVPMDGPMEASVQSDLEEAVVGALEPIDPTVFCGEAPVELRRTDLAMEESLVPSSVLPVTDDGPADTGVPAAEDDLPAEDAPAATE